MTRRPVFLLIGILVFGAMADAETVETSQQHAYRVRELAHGLDHPWSLAFLPDGDALVTERSGQLRRLTPKGLVEAPLLGVPKVVARGQGGLLDVALDPDFVDQGVLYLCYSGKGKGGANTEVARAVLRDNRLQKVEIIFRAEPRTGGANHFGCRIAFDSDKSLYVSLGDRYQYMQEAQNPDNHLGTIVRINRDGSIPQDNPFAAGKAPEVYSYGHRNVQGLTIRPSDGALWAHEHGPRGGDEVNIIRAGVNYGWPAITYGVDYSGAIISDKTEAPGMAQPVVYWDPSIAPSGMAFYEGEAFPKWRGNLFVGSLRFTHLRRLTMAGDKVVAQEELLRARGERIRDVRLGPDGLLYLLTDSSKGKVLRLEPVK